MFNSIYDSDRQYYNKIAFMITKEYKKKKNREPLQHNIGLSINKFGFDFSIKLN